MDTVTQSISDASKSFVTPFKPKDKTIEKLDGKAKVNETAGKRKLFSYCPFQRKKLKLKEEESLKRKGNECQQVCSIYNIESLF